MINLRPHQERAVRELRDGFRAGHLRQILVMPTGAGKTVTAAHIADCARRNGNLPLFIVDRIALADQAVETMVRAGLRTSLLRGAESRMVTGHDVVVASIQTLARRKLPDASLLLIDECHILYRAHARLLERWDAVPTIGLTATPFTRGLGQYFTNLVAPTSIQELTDNRLLVPAIPFGPAKFDVDAVAIRGGDYVVGELSKAVNRVELHAEVVSTWKRLGEGRPTLVFCVDIAHSKAVASAFQEAGVNAAHVDGYMDRQERQISIERFRIGEITVLCSVACLSVGFDAPNASCLVLARPTKSPTLHVQQIGRGLRAFEGKTGCIVIDHAGNIERFGLPSDLQIGELDTHEKTWPVRLSNDPQPRPCPSCAHLKPPRIHSCPICGFSPERQNTVRTLDSEIVPLTDHARNHSDRRLYQEFLGVAKTFGKSPGWAFHLFVEMKKTKPQGSWAHLEPIEPSSAMRNFAKSQLIRFAKSRKATRT
ncbi:MAG: DEAD/DEAH box helicase [Gammaproteobacteria bacterium]